MWFWVALIFGIFSQIFRIILFDPLDSVKTKSLFEVRFDIANSLIRMFKRFKFLGVLKRLKRKGRWQWIGNMMYIEICTSCHAFQAYYHIFQYIISFGFPVWYTFWHIFLTTLTSNALGQCAGDGIRQTSWNWGSVSDPQVPMFLLRKIKHTSNFQKLLAICSYHWLFVVTTWLFVGMIWYIMFFNWYDLNTPWISLCFSKSFMSSSPTKTVEALVLGNSQLCRLPTGPRHATVLDAATTDRRRVVVNFITPAVTKKVLKMVKILPKYLVSLVNSYHLGPRCRRGVSGEFWRGCLKLFSMAMGMHLHSMIHTIGVVDMKMFLFMFVVYSTPTLGVFRNYHIHPYVWQWYTVFFQKKSIEQPNRNCDYLSRPYT